jgi:heparanase
VRHCGLGGGSNTNNYQPLEINSRTKKIESHSSVLAEQKPYFFSPKHQSFRFIEPLAKELAPSYLRFGGTQADALIFQEKADLNFVIEVPTPCPARADSTRIWHNFTFTGFPKRTKYIILNLFQHLGHQLDQIYNFAKNTGMRFIFDLNMVLRSGSRWDPSNAIRLIEYAKRRGYDLDFELGNGRQ